MTVQRRRAEGFLEDRSVAGGSQSSPLRSAWFSCMLEVARLAGFKIDWQQISTDPELLSLTCRMAQRVTIRKRTPYNTTSNRRRVVKTPGGKLVVHHIKKLAVSCLGLVIQRGLFTDPNSLPPSAVTAVRLLPVSPPSAPASTRLCPSARRPSTAPTVDPSAPPASSRASPALSSSRRRPSSSASSRPRPPPLRSRLRDSASDGRWILASGDVLIPSRS